VADTFLMIPDLFNYFFTGVKAVEFTNASTTQLVDPRTKDWARELVQWLQLPGHMLRTIIRPGTVLGPLRRTVSDDTGLRPVPVIAPATHDTGSAVAAVPAATTHYAYISSGTWSLMGTELTTPLVTEQTLACNFTNEGGVGGTTRLLKNIMGLWLVQECRRAWQRAGKDFGYDELARLAEAAPPFAAIVNPDDPSFMLPPDMPAALGKFCHRSGQSAPQEPGAVVRCALESLALRYRWVLDKLEELVGNRLEVIHVVGGGSQNALLCQFTADACNRPVHAGPVEATAIGNVLVQALGLGLIGSLAEGRDLVRRSFDVVTYLPHQPDRWDEPYRRFLSFI
jgi:rhamnulokinase